MPKLMSTQSACKLTQGTRAAAAVVFQHLLVRQYSQYFYVDILDVT